MRREMNWSGRRKTNKRKKRRWRDVNIEPVEEKKEGEEVGGEGKKKR